MKLPTGARFTFDQDEDSNGRGDMFSQELHVELADAGGGPYVVLSTERWAIDLGEIDVFAERLKWCAKQVRDAGEPETSPRGIGSEQVEG